MSLKDEIIKRSGIPADRLIVASIPTANSVNKPMKFILRINIDNAAFDGSDSGPAIADILETVAREIRDHGDVHDGFEKQLFDVNGNRVGNAYTD
jgi:hypothetical protein